MIYNYRQHHHYKAMEEIDTCEYEHNLKIDKSETPQANDYCF